MWVKCALLYTAFGCFAAAILGGLLGLLGVYTKAVLSPGLLILLALVLAFREWEWLTFRLPQCRLQTESNWAREFGFPTASAMWGFHLGLGFFTYASHGGFLFLVGAALVIGSPIHSVLLMMVYWLGRAASVWVAPFLWSGNDLGDLMQAITNNRRRLHTVVGLTLLWASIAILCLRLLWTGGSLK